MDKILFMLSADAVPEHAYKSIIVNFILSLAFFMFIFMFNKHNQISNCRLICLLVLFSIIGIFLTGDKYHGGQFIGSNIILCVIFITILSLMFFKTNNNSII